MSLKGSYVESAGRPGLISEICPNIQQLDISYTKLQDFSQVLQICKELPQLEFLDISGVPLTKSSFKFHQQRYSVKTLVMSNLQLNEKELKVVSDCFPEVEMLVLGSLKTNFTSVFDECFVNIKSLHLPQSNVTSPEDLLMLAKLPFLEELILAGNDLEAIPELEDSDFRKLKELNLENTLVSSLHCINNLNSLESLKHVRLNNTPVQNRLSSQFRTILISYLPKVSILNGGHIDSHERTTAERQFLRDFSDPEDPSLHKPEKPLVSSEHSLNAKVFEVVLGKRGVVYKFAEVNLAPPKEAMVVFRTEETEEQYCVPLNWKLPNLKKMLEKIYGIPSEEQELWYGDHEVIFALGFQLLDNPKKKLWELKFKDEDIVLVKRADSKL